MLEDNAIWLAVIAFTAVVEGLAAAWFANWLENRQQGRNQKFALDQEEREYRRAIETEEREHRRAVEAEEREYRRSLEREKRDREHADLVAEREHRYELERELREAARESEETVVECGECERLSEELSSLKSAFESFKESTKDDLGEMYSMVHSYRALSSGE